MGNNGEMSLQFKGILYMEMEHLCPHHNPSLKTSSNVSCHGKLFQHVLTFNGTTDSSVAAGTLQLG